MSKLLKIATVGRKPLSNKQKMYKVLYKPAKSFHMAVKLVNPCVCHPVDKFPKQTVIEAGANEVF